MGTHNVTGSVVRVLQRTRAESVEFAIDFAEIQLISTSADSMQVETEDAATAMRNLAITGYMRMQHLKPFISYDRLTQKYGIEFQTADSCQICDKRFIALIRPMQNCRFCGQAVCSACRSARRATRVCCICIFILLLFSKRYRVIHRPLTTTDTHDTHIQYDSSSDRTF